MILAELITTGEEVLNGELVDTNARWLSRRLVEIGVTISRRITVGDRLQDLVDVFRESAHRAEIVIVNGGLGPTVDDLSAEAAARALGEPRCLNEQWASTLEDRFRSSGRIMSPNNLRQAELPKSAQIIDNPIGTACGFWIRLDRAVLYFTPGVPPEMKRMMTHSILPHICETFQLDAPLRLKRLRCFGLAEANLDAMLAEQAPPKGLQIGFRAHFPTIEIKLTPSGNLALEDIDRFVAALPDSIREFVVNTDGDSMEATIAKEMVHQKCTLALAESCTGGLIAKRLVDIPGSSAFFLASFVTYANSSKIRNLGIDPALIEEHGAVSVEVAESMAKAAMSNTDATHALAISGIAGPEGGTEQKPVGTLCVALATRESTMTQQVHIPNFGRKRIRMAGAYLAFDMLRRQLKDLPVFADYTYIKRVSVRKS